MFREAAKLNSANGIAFLINLKDETKLPKLSPEAVSSKIEVHQTLINRRAVSPDMRNTYNYFYVYKW